MGSSNPVGLTTCSIISLPEVSLVAILDADREGFLRSTSSLIQTVGRAARNINGKAILYADKITPAMKNTLDETTRRRAKQQDFNQENHITPTSVKKQIQDILEAGLSTKKSTSKVKMFEAGKNYEYVSIKEVQARIKELEAMMYEAAKNLEFERAGVLRDEINKLRSDFITLS